MKDTRVQLLDRKNNLLITRGGVHIIWIAGMAGSGKTSIALTLCRMLAKEPTIVLGGTFFCSRSTGTVERTDVRCIIPTLAAILARRVPDYAEALADELKDDPDLAHKSIDAQVEHFLARPLEGLKSFNHQIVFVIDALDECSDDEKLVELINALASFTSPTPVKFLLTSRPEMHIRDTSIAETSLSSVVHLQAIDQIHVTTDIRLYIQKTLESRAVTSDWYTKHDLDELAKLSGGLFIFASTALAYILGRKDVPGRSERLRTVKMQTSTSALATASLDNMYSLVLTHASDTDAFEPTELDEMRRIVAAILSLRAPLTLRGLAEILGLTSERLRGALGGLHAVIFVPDEDDEGELRTLHASFGDFIFTRAPEHIRISKELGHDELTRGCLKRMTADDLCFNISRSATSYRENHENELETDDNGDDDNFDDDEDDEDDDYDEEEDEEDSGDDDSHNDDGDDGDDDKPNWIANSLIYACIHWAHHVELSSVKSAFDNQINSVLRRKLLFWLELLSIIGEVRRASNLLRIAASVVSACPV